MTRARHCNEGNAATAWAGVCRGRGALAGLARAAVVAACVALSPVFDIGAWAGEATRASARACERAAFEAAVQTSAASLARTNARMGARVQERLRALRQAQGWDRATFIARAKSLVAEGEAGALARRQRVLTARVQALGERRASEPSSPPASPYPAGGGAAYAAAMAGAGLSGAGLSGASVASSPGGKAARRTSGGGKSAPCALLGELERRLQALEATTQQRWALVLSNVDRALAEADQP